MERVSESRTEILAYHVEHISELPTDILIQIISRLTLPEATRTSVLSKRWRPLYHYITCINFHKTSEPFVYSERQMQESFETINHVLSKHRAKDTLKEFSLSIPSMQGLNMDSWFEIALASRELQIFDIYLDFFYSHDLRRTTSYPCPIETLILKHGPGPRSSLSGLRSLKELSLSSVNINDREVTLLLSNCVLLEFLSIEVSRILKNVAVVGDTLKLKHLEIHHCIVESIEIRNVVSLVTFRAYNFCRPILVLENVPALVEISTDIATFVTLAGHFSGINRHLAQLTLLIWHSIMGNPLEYERFKLPKLPEFVNLKHLILKVNLACGVWDILHLTPLIVASPILQELDVQFIRDVATIKQRKTHERFYAKDPRHYHLRKVTLSGYLGSPLELEFVKYILYKVPALKELIIVPCKEVASYQNQTRIRRKAATRAWKQLQGITPKSVDLVIA